VLSRLQRAEAEDSICNASDRVCRSQDVVDVVVEPLSLCSCTPSRRHTSIIYLGVRLQGQNTAAGVLDRSLTDANRAATYCVERVIAGQCIGLPIDTPTQVTFAIDLLRASKTGDYGLYKGELKEGFSPRSGTAVVRYAVLYVRRLGPSGALCHFAVEQTGLCSSVALYAMCHVVFGTCLRVRGCWRTSSIHDR
jgi:hypothetical protein